MLLLLLLSVGRRCRLVYMRARRHTACRHLRHVLGLLLTFLAYGVRDFCGCV